MFAKASPADAEEEQYVGYVFRVFCCLYSSACVQACPHHSVCVSVCARTCEHACMHACVSLRGYVNVSTDAHGVQTRLPDGLKLDL